MIAGVWRASLIVPSFVTLALAPTMILAAQDVPRRISGRVLEAETGRPVRGATISLEGQLAVAQSDSAGRYMLLRVPAGPQVLIARRIGYMPGRVPVTVGRVDLVIDVTVARNSLRLREVRVTADAAGRARGELGTASVINREAIANQTAASLAGVLELIPGVPFEPPGLDGIQQVSLRAVPTSMGGGAGGTSAADLASFGTLIILDGVPLSNNANLQSSGAGAQIGFASSAGGGVDIRRIPATMLERVEVIRGVPSARFGDLTQGAIIVETRAGAVAAELLGRYDARTSEATVIGAHTFAAKRQALAFNADIARTRIAPGQRDDAAMRLGAQLSHRIALGAFVTDGAVDRSLTLDSRLDVHQLYQDTPERPAILRGYSNWSRDNALRLSERLTWRGTDGRQLRAIASVERTGQNSYSQRFLLRGPEPFSALLAPGRDTGFFIGGEYLAKVRVSGVPWLVYARVEGERPFAAWRAQHLLRTGVELRREWNAGAGYQFDVAAPPQTTFNGIAGYARPRRYDAVRPMATSGLYLDGRLQRATPLGGLEVQAGARLDVLHTGTTWASNAQSALAQPRLAAQLSPWSWLRLRGGAGRMAKAPSLAQLDPAPRFFDVVNVNWYANAPAERLAVLTTYVRDPENARLGFARTDRLEAGFELDLGRGGATLGVTAYDDRLRHAPSTGDAVDAVLRERFTIADSSAGTGRPPGYIEPADVIDTVPVLLGRLENNLSQRSRGIEVTMSTPTIPMLRTRLEVQGAWLDTRMRRDGYEFVGSAFYEFQLRDHARIPFYDATTRTGKRSLLTWRLVHHQPAVGLVVTASVQQALNEAVQDRGITDSLSFAGYVTRAGERVLVPRAERLDAQYADLWGPRTDLVARAFTTPNGWIMNLQVAKALPQDGRLSFYAFNALGLVGRYGDTGAVNRLNPPVRFGMELSMPLGAFTGARGGR